MNGPLAGVKLASQPVVNDSIAGEDILVFFDAATDTALAFDRKVGGKTLSFRIAKSGGGAQTILVDNETGSKWVAFTGKAVGGELEGSLLQQLPSHLSFWFAWTEWNQDTKLYVG